MPPPTITVEFRLPDGTSVLAETRLVSDNLMTLARRTGVPGIRGECGGNLACASCHVHVAPEWLNKLEPASDEERELLTFTSDPKPNSRLGCQIWLSAELSGLVVTPAE